MQSLSWYWRRILSMDGPEIAWRIRGLLRSQLDAIRIPLGLIPSIPAANLPATNNFEPGFSCSPVIQEDWVDPISESQQAWRKRLIEKADQVLGNRLSYFDLDSVHHGDPINWHRDFSAEIDAPIILSGRTDYRDFSKFGDCKLVWEPNRHHQLVVLGRAYVATGERKYAVKVAELLRSWIDANPFGYGMNWKSPLELGVRLINWVWAIDFIRDANVFDDELWADILQNVYLAMWDCQRKFSQGSSANNHLIGEAAGVFVAACYFDTLPNAERWRKSSQNILEREIIAQSYSDGCTREHAFGYQFFVIQFFLLCMQSGDATGNSFSEESRNRLHHMYRFMDEICFDTGQPPNSGDQDDGYVLDLGNLPVNAHELLSVGGYQFEDPELISSSSSETVFWLFRNPDQETTVRNRPRPSISFRESGYSILRSKRMSVFFDCSELGYGSLAAHGHADCLSFCLSVDGLPIFVDPGTYDYFTHPEWRKYFRETRAHNTVEIDGISQSQMLGPFMWGQRAEPANFDFREDGNHILATGEHDGYARLDDPASHRRSIRLNSEGTRFTIDDSIFAKRAHTAKIFFHVDPLCRLNQVSANVVEVRAEGLEIMFCSRHGKVRCVKADNFSKTGWTSRGYHSKHRSSSIVVEHKFVGNIDIRAEVQLRTRCH